MTARTTTIASLLSATFLAACTAPLVKPPSTGHIGAEGAPPPTKSNIPQPVQQSVALPKPKPVAKTETYSVVVKDVRVHELLFALARDAKLNVDIHPGIAGTVTLKPSTRPCRNCSTASPSRWTCASSSTAPTWW